MRAHRRDGTVEAAGGPPARPETERCIDDGREAIGPVMTALGVAADPNSDFSNAKVASKEDCLNPRGNVYLIALAYCCGSPTSIRASTAAKSLSTGDTGARLRLRLFCQS